MTMSGCAGHTFLMAVRELPSVTVASLAQEPNASCDAATGKRDPDRLHTWVRTRLCTHALNLYPADAGCSVPNDNLHDVSAGR